MPVIGSSRIIAPMNKVDTGPIMPACDVVAGPMRDTATIVSKTGNTVQNTALNNDNPYTGIGCTSIPAGRTRKNCTMQATLDTHIAYATSRNAPTRRTNSPDNSK